MSGEHLRVELVRTGGFGGLELTSVVDTENLTGAEAADLADRLLRAGLPGLDDAGGQEATGGPGPGGPGSGAPGPAGWPGATEGATAAPPVPDAFRYHLSVQRGERRWEGEFTERQVPARLRPLLALLMDRGRHGPVTGPA
jgi:hypothetical protein